MAAEPYSHSVPYQTDINAVFKLLREDVFKKGEYRGSELNPKPMQEALENMEADGTASILDIERVGEEIEPGVLAPLDEETLREIFGTARPTIEMIKEHDFDIYGWIDRGECIYITVYKDGKPDTIFFAGYSYD
jgi:hypothetical protein